MSEAAKSSKGLKSIEAALRAMSHNPSQLRVVLAVGLAVVWYMAVYQPLQGQLDSATQRLDTERKRLALASQVERMREEVARFEQRLPVRVSAGSPVDPNEAVQHLLDGVRRLPVRLVSVDPGQVQEFGPYKAVSVKIKAEGSYADLDRMLRWVETNPRMFRVDAIVVEPAEAVGAAARAAASKDPCYAMDLTVVGVIG
jgi:type II secretory pathway component PulM